VGDCWCPACKNPAMVRSQAGTVALLLVVAGILGASVAAKEYTQIPYPTGYPKWVCVRTMLVGPQSKFFADSGGMHHIYANEKAMEGYVSGKFPDGSVLVFDLLDVIEKDGVTSEGRRQRIDVMLRDSARFGSTGGWGFERFAGDSQTERPLTEEHRQACFTCDQQVKAQDFVFSHFRE
jgi:hypothetical protein